MDIFEKRNTSCPRHESNHNLLVIQPKYSHYTDCTILAQSTQYSCLVRNCAQQLYLQSAAMYIHTTADHYTHFNQTDAISLTTFCAPVLLACCESCHNAAHHTKVLLNLAKSVWPNTQTSQQYSWWVRDISPH